MNAPWQVTSQRETVGLNPATANYAPMIEVTFRTQDGTVGTVNVAKDKYGPDTVRDAINAYVAKINDVIGLTPGATT